MGYYMGAWWTECKLYAETDNEAIFDADEEYAKNSKPYPVALCENNRFVKRYN